MTNLTDLNKYYRTDNATATASDIAIGKTAYVNGGKVTGTGVYSPAMMQFDGSTGYYSLGSTALDVSGGITVVGRIKLSGATITSAGGFNRGICQLFGTSYLKLQVSVVNDETGDDRAGCLAVFVQSTTQTTLASLFSNTVVSDGGVYTFFASYDPSGIAQLYINGISDINTGAAAHALISGTIETGSGVGAIGARATPDRYVDGDIGFLGVRGSYLTNWQDFMHANGDPKVQDETTWANSGWGAQPLFWNEHGDMENNLGSAGNMTRNGTIVVGKGGSLV